MLSHPRDDLRASALSNPFLSRAGFDKNITLTMIFEGAGRNPFLSRAGFDQSSPTWGLFGDPIGRNPFLSRAGFDKLMRF